MTLRAWLQERVTPPTLGQRGERAAAKMLRRLGYHVITTRRRHRYGEIDIIAVDKTGDTQTVVFVEVKTRRSDQHGRPAEAVDDTRQARLTRAALAFLKSHGLLEYACRFDVVEVIWPEDARQPTIHHIRNAFPAASSGQFYS